MGQKFYFFTDPALLSQQTPEQAFGPQPSANGKDIFRITSDHPVSGPAPAFAVCDGMLCAQSDGAGSLTLILKPTETPPFEAPQASYYIYRGIDAASLLSGNNLLDEAATAATTLTKRVAKDWNDQNNNDLTNSKNAFGLDRTAVYIHTSTGGTSVNPFADDCYVEQLFQYPHPTIQLPLVKAGEKLGSFATAAKFEVVLHRLGHRPKLSLARKPDHLIEVDDLATAGNDFKHWHSKEQALTFLDPAAFFGSFVQSALTVNTGSYTQKKTGNDIFEDVLNKFANSQTAWLDIRGNQAYSYNLFGLYDDVNFDNQILFEAPRDSTQTSAINFRRDGWPLLKLNLAELPGKTRKGLRRTSVRIPIGHSREPVAILSKGFVRKREPLKPDERVSTIKQLVAADTHYSGIKVSFPVYTANGDTVLAASYTRINIYEKVNELSTGTAPLHIYGKHYLDGLFRPLDLQLLPDFRNSTLRFDIYPEEVLVDLEWQAGPTYAASVGVAEDDASVTYFAFPMVEIPNIHWLNGKLELINWAQTLSSVSNTKFFESISEPFALTEIKKKTIAPDDSNQNNNIDLLVVRHEPSLDFDPPHDSNSLDDCCFVALPKTTHQSLIGVGELDEESPVFLTVAAVTRGNDSQNNQRYFETSLQYTKFSFFGTQTAVSNFHLPQKVFGYANT